MKNSQNKNDKDNYCIALVPAYNEGDRLEASIRSIKKTKYIDEIVVIDDGSTDNTLEVASTLDIKVLQMEQNSGKGAAIKRGLDYALCRSDIIIFLDADLSTSSDDVDKLIKPIIDGECDVTIARFQRAKKKGGFGLVKGLARYGVKHFTGKTIDTAIVGQRAFKTEVLKNIKSIPNNYGIEISMVIDILRLGYSVKEVDVTMSHRETERNLRGFYHRGRQFSHILGTLLNKR